MNPRPYALRRMLPDPPRGFARVKHVLGQLFITTLGLFLLIAILAAVNVLFS